MEIFRELQASLAHTLGQEFEQAEGRFETLLAQREERNNEIQEARQEERDRQYSALNQEYELRGSRIKDLEDQLKDLDKWHERALEAETLREDNAELQRELETLKSGTRASEQNKVDGDLVQNLDVDRPDLVIQDFTEHGDPDTIPYSSYTEVATRYQRLFHKARQLAKALSRLREQHRESKRAVQDWHHLLEKEVFTTVVNEKRIIFRRVDNNEARDLRDAQSDRPVTVNGPETTAKGLLEEPAASKTLKQLLREENGSLECHDYQDPTQPSLPAVTTATAQSPPVKTEQGDSDDDEIQEITNSTPASTLEVENDNAATEFGHDTSNASRNSASNSLKRAQHQRHNEEAQSSTSSNRSRKPVTIKSEQTSSSPLRNSVQHHGLNSLDTQDLDEIDDSIQTPKRKKVGHAASNQEKLPFSILQDDNVSELAQRSHSGHQYGDLRQNAAILQPRDRNQNIVRRPDEKEEPGRDAKRKRDDGRGAKAIHIITEDGEKDFYMGRRKGQGTPRNLRGSTRLNDLLEAGSSPKKELTPRPQPQSAGPKVFSNSTRDPTNQPSLFVTPSKASVNRPTVSARQARPTSTFGSEFKKPDNRWAPADSTSFNQGAATTSSHGEPYRSRPIDRLSLENFKINPERNEGIDYAFDDVVRKRDQRQCLPGCTRPDCCGSGFRAMAKLGGLSALPGRKSGNEDTEILENYLGDQKHKLNTMSEDERYELLIDAKAEALATRYGRHRYAHERHHSPPGFWRTDMPSTQELERDREEAKRMEREKVASRYREAMRPGGMWKFADE